MSRLYIGQVAHKTALGEEEFFHQDIQRPAKSPRRIAVGLSFVGFHRWMRRYGSTANALLFVAAAPPGLMTVTLRVVVKALDAIITWTLN